MINSNNINGSIVVISGPSGCGKSSLLKEVYKSIDNYYFSISTTTRKIRENEKDGVDYHFVTKEQFQSDIKNNNFLEWAEVHGNYYGTSLKPVQEALSCSKVVIFDIDVQGHTLIRKQLDYLTTSVFITTPSLQELKNRLYNRATDNDKVIAQRIENAKKEIHQLDEYDYFIINDDLMTASKQLLSIIQCSQIKSSLLQKDDFISKWEID